jgi:hypothetical protein
VKDLFDWDKLADFLEPPEQINLFEPINELSIEELEKRYLRNPNSRRIVESTIF